MARRFQNQSALITGAASGIGLACAQRLAEEGAARLVLVDIDGNALRDASKLLTFNGLTVETLAGDVGDPAFWDLVQDALAGIDIGIVNAGIADNGTIDAMPFDRWRRVMNVNLDGAFLTLKALFQSMIDQGNGGSVVLTASVSGIKAEPGTGAYAASKAGVIQLARVAAKEGAPHRIRVNAIAPGGVETPIWGKTPFFADLIEETGGEAAAFAAMGAGTPMGRFGTAAEIAGQIAFLLSADSGTTTGSVLVSDGGYSL
jgi:NAD(P)-dependent dehydrogenase (short-subunit alcohol dehydrogenase family)